MENIDHLILGCLGSAIPSGPRLDHAVRYFSTWSGSDKLMMTAQYSAKLLALLTLLRAKLQFRAGRRAKPISPTSNGLRIFAGQLSLARRVSGFWGILAVIKALAGLERARTGSRMQINLQRLQGLSMLLFYPLDYISFFSSPFAPILHRVSPSMSHRAQLWSVRAWGVYVGLQIISLLGEWKEYEARGSKEDGDADCVTVKKRKQAVMCQLVANVSRSPVILHWSVIGGIYSNELWTDVLSFISAVAAFSGGWESMRVSPPRH